MLYSLYCQTNIWLLTKPRYPEGQNTQNPSDSAVFTSLSFCYLMLHCLHASLTICVCFMLLIHIHLRCTFKAFDWFSLCQRIFYLDLFAYSFWMYWFVLFATFSAHHSFLYLIWFLFIRFIWLIAQPTIWWTATVWTQLLKVISWNPFQYYTLYCPILNPVPHPVLHFYSIPNQSWNPYPPFPSLQFSSNDYK